MILKLDDVINDFANIGVMIGRENGWLMLTGEGACPKQSWVDSTFADAFHMNQSKRGDVGEGIGQYVFQRWMCGPISVFGAVSQMRREWAMTPAQPGQEELGLWVGAFAYLIGNDPKKAHCIVWFDEDHTIHFREPQVWMVYGSGRDAQLNLTDEERGSNFGGAV